MTSGGPACKCPIRVTGDAGACGGLPQSVGPGGRHRQQQFVIVAAGQAGGQPIRARRAGGVGQRHQSAAISAARPLARHRWPRSCTSPSDTSIAGRGDAGQRQADPRLRQPVAVQQEAGRIGQPALRHRQPQRAVADRAGDPDLVAGLRAEAVHRGARARHGR